MYNRILSRIKFNSKDFMLDIIFGGLMHWHKNLLVILLKDIPNFSLINNSQVVDNAHNNVLFSILLYPDMSNKKNTDEYLTST